MFEILTKGGPVIIPLLLCSLAAVTVAVERGLFFYRLGRNQRELVSALEKPLSRRDFPAALEQCQRFPSPLAAILSALLQDGNRLSSSTGTGQNSGGATRASPLQSSGGEKVESPPKLTTNHSPPATVFAEATRSLERFFPVLDTVVTMAPLLGLLGTVTGMIRSFGILSLRGIGHPTAITGGVAEALIATAMGLAIAIFSLFFYNLFQARAENVRTELEAHTHRFLAWLKAAD